MLKPADPASLKKADEPPIGDILGRLIDDAEAYGRAELKVPKTIAEAKVDALKIPSVLLAASLFFAQSALTVLAIGLALALVPFVGPLVAGLIAFLVFGGIAALLVWLGWTRLRQGVVKSEPPSVLAARAEVEAARKQMMETLNELQSQFAPRALVREAWETAREKGAELAEETVDAVKARPLAATGVVAAITMFLAREPLMDLAGKLFDSDKRKARKRRKTKTKPDKTETVE